MFCVWHWTVSYINIHVWQRNFSLNVIKHADQFSRKTSVCAIFHGFNARIIYWAICQSLQGSYNELLWSFQLSPNSCLTGHAVNVTASVLDMPVLRTVNKSLTWCLCYCMSRADLVCLYGLVNMLTKNVFLATALHACHTIPFLSKFATFIFTFKIGLALTPHDMVVCFGKDCIKCI